jgi:tRNA pseudouridine55 synthase
MENDTGFLLVDKPAGWTSFDVIAKLRRITGIRKIGHTGTLDPFATGLLLVAVGRSATKRIDEFMGASKEYLAEIVLGATTETLDTEGEIQLDEGFVAPGECAIGVAIEQMIGDGEQIPPMFSALKKDGKKLYELAREGKTIERPPRPITIHSFTLEGVTEREDGRLVLQTRIRVSSGTYIRVIAQDLALSLGTTGYLSGLRRTMIDDFAIEASTPISDITPENWRGLLQEL